METINNNEIINIETNINISPENNLKCHKCSSKIDKKIGTAKICKLCHNKVFRDYYKNKIIPNKKYFMKRGYEKEYINKTGEIIILTLMSDTKVCRICNIKKDFFEYNFINNKYKDKYEKKYLAPDCKVCTKEITKYKNKFIKDMIIKNNVLEDNEIVNNIILSF